MVNNMELKIYCPSCDRYIMKHDGITKTPITCMCRRCHKVVRYDPSTNKTELKDKPQRTMASGTRFW